MVLWTLLAIGIVVACLFAAITCVHKYITHGYLLK